MTIDEHEPITLSSHALSALQDFYTQRDTHADRFEKLRTQAEKHDAELSMDSFAEDWQESQFWYSDETANLFARELLAGATEDTTVAVVSTPSVFVALKNLVAKQDASKPKPKLLLLEHDRRFAVFPEFVYYDYNEPTRLPTHLKSTASRLICDPPFLNPECQTKMALTLRWLSVTSSLEPPRLVVCTGERMKDLVLRLYRAFGLRTTSYEPEHRGLKNEFLTYANFDAGVWKLAETEKEMREQKRERT